jgi:Protein kinase domain
VTVGRYEIVGELGRGGMATVYLARQQDLGRLAALKELGAFRSADPSFARRFLREAQLAGSLSDPNIVTVYDYFEANGAPYIAMEYLEHGSLRPHVGNMTLAQIGGVLQSMLAGLDAAERRAIVHRDLKPENLLVTGEGRVKIADFGIAKATNELRTTALTSTGVAVGTPNYMAPEQATAQAVGPWTDLYSVGMMAFEFFIGRPAFGDTDNALGVLLRQVNEEIPPVHELDPHVDVDLSSWVAKMVAKEPGERPRSAVVAWDELEDVLIALLGARWQRQARLPLDPAPIPPRLTGAAAAAPPAEPRLGTTIAPRVLAEPLPTPIVEAKPTRKVGRKAARLIVAGVAVAAVAAGLLARTGGSPTPSTPVADTTSVSAKAAPTTASAPAAAVDQRNAAQRPAASPSLGTQAASARRQATNYDKAAARLEKLSGARVAGSPTARLAAAMRQTAADYRVAAAAADVDDRAGYDAAMRRVASDKTTVNQALADLRSAAAAPPAPRPAPAPSAAPTPCSGDSVSDDPSDDSC